MFFNGVSLFKIKYVKDDSKDPMQWTTHILAMSWQDAEEFIRKEVGASIRVEERGGCFPVDAATELVIPTTEKAKEVIKEVIKEVYIEGTNTDDGDIKCPWCKKPYKNLKALRTHINKSHAE